uniref:Uncharacterized protein n=1 Tax=Rhizophora mucronata TaxID=61149 RepID=A0A2P2NX25_RHIMU
MGYHQSQTRRPPDPTRRFC